MLLLQRHEGETIHIGDAITVQVQSIQGKRTTLAIDAPRDVLILRGELREREDADTLSKPPRLGGCCCGEPCTLGTVHRADGPCFVYEQPADSGRVGDEFKFTDEDIRLALDYSRNYATARPDISPTAKEHVSGLCDRLESLLADRAALASQGQGEAVEIEAVGRVERDMTGDLGINWLIEGGIHGVGEGSVLLCADRDNVTDDEGSATLYTSAPPASPAGVPDGWASAVSDALAVIKDAAQFHGELPVGMYRHIQPRLTALLAAAPPAGVPDGYVMVPARFGIDKDAWEAAQFAFGGPGTGEGEEFMDCTAWIGEIENDDGSKTHGMHIQCDECPEEGSITLAEFAAAPSAPEGDA